MRILLFAFALAVMTSVPTAARADWDDDLPPLDPPKPYAVPLSEISTTPDPSTADLGPAPETAPVPDAPVPGDYGTDAADTRFSRTLFAV